MSPNGENCTQLTGIFRGVSRVMPGPLRVRRESMPRAPARGRRDLPPDSSISEYDLVPNTIWTKERGKRMSESRHTEAQIIVALEQVEAGRMGRSDSRQPLAFWVEVAE